jgi:hypothetical protein
MYTDVPWDSGTELTEEELKSLGLTPEAIAQAVADFEAQVTPEEDEFAPVEPLEQYHKFINTLGSRYNIVSGKFVLDDNGEFLVTNRLLGTGTIYLDTKLETYTVLSDNPFVGLPYILKSQNCAILTAKYLDYAKKDGVGYEKLMKSIPMRRLIYYFRNAVNPLLESIGFVAVDVKDIQLYDIIVWQFNKTATSHMGVYLGDNKMIHHIPSMISCIDTIDLNSPKVLGVYRYGG